MADRAAELARLKAAVVSTLTTATAEQEQAPFARVCQACVEVLPVDGASISLMTGEQHRETLYASDEVIDTIEELQFTLGEGPCFQAFHTGRPVLVPDLQEASTTAWPVFASSIGAHPVRAVYAFPVGIGAIRVGALDMYRREPGLLDVDDLATALQFVDVAAMALLWLRGAVAAAGPATMDWPDLPGRSGHWQVHQATGMVKVQLGIDIEEAFARLRAHAFATDQLVNDVAREVVSGRMRFDLDGRP